MNEDDSVDQKASFSGERGGSVSIKIRCILELVRGSLHGHCLTRTTDIRLDMRKFIFLERRYYISRAALSKLDNLHRNCLPLPPSSQYPRRDRYENYTDTRSWEV